MKANKQEITLRPGESRELVIVQDQPGLDGQDAEWKITLPEGASLNMVLLSLQGTVRNRLEVSLCGEGADCRLSGLYLASGDEHMDYDILLTHHVPGCRSQQLFKGMLSGRSVTHFDGLIRVVPDAQKTEAYQANHNLLLGDDARAHTRPQLEIYADDVKCSHGATVGRLNPEELFYLRSRGIRLAEARMLQQLAFAGEVIERISSKELRERLRGQVEERLRSAF